MEGKISDAQGTYISNIHHAFQDRTEVRGEDKASRVDINGDSYIDNSEDQIKSSIGPQVTAAISVSLGSMVVGFASAYTSPALVSMNITEHNQFELTEQGASWIGGIMPLTALLGGILGGPLIELIGRKWTIAFTTLPFIASWLCIAMAWNVFLLLVGRAIAGFGVGIASLSLPVYLGETVQAEVRGTLGLLPTALGNVGILLCFVAGKYLNWYHLAWLGAFLPIPFCIMMIVIPDTPRWYIARNDEKGAKEALEWLRGKGAQVTNELQQIQKTHEASLDSDKGTLQALFQAPNRVPLLISIGLMFFQQMSGINAVIFYTVTIFKEAGSTIDENLCTIIIGVVNFISIFIATLLIDRMGRKPLLYLSAVSMALSSATLGNFFYLISSTDYDVTEYGWVPLMSLIVFVIGFSLGFGPIPWLMMGEILPAKVRGSAASVATAFNWSCTFIVTKTFTDVIACVGTHGAFWMFGIFCLLSLFFVMICVPETQGKSLEDIERNFQGPVRRASSVANMKISPSNL